MPLQKSQAKKPPFYDSCRIKKTKKKKKGSIVFLHGFASFIQWERFIADKFRDLGYDTYQCNARGHGTRLFDGEKVDWDLNVKETHQLVNYIHDKKKEDNVVVIGQSMGGMIGLTVANQNPNVKKMFAISAPNHKNIDFKSADKFTLLAFSVATMKNVKNLNYNDPRYDGILPEDNNKCRPENKNRFYLLHSKKDEVVTPDHYFKNKKQLCLPNSNTILFDNGTKQFSTPNVPIIPSHHLGVQFTEEAFNFIAKRL